LFINHEANGHEILCLVCTLWWRCAAIHECLQANYKTYLLAYWKNPTLSEMCLIRR
jgi:hypothetical protein